MSHSIDDILKIDQAFQQEKRKLKETYKLKLNKKTQQITSQIDSLKEKLDKKKSASTHPISPSKTKTPKPQLPTKLDQKLDRNKPKIKALITSHLQKYIDNPTSLTP